MSYKEMLVKSNVQVVLAVFIIVFCFYALAFLTLDNDIRIVFAGYIGSVIGFYFGSSRSSQLKDENKTSNQ